jgi:hypothetical protein
MEADVSSITFGPPPISKLFDLLAGCAPIDSQLNDERCWGKITPEKPNVGKSVLQFVDFIMQQKI